MILVRARSLISVHQTLMDETSDSPPRATFGNVRIPSEARGDTPRLLPVEKVCPVNVSKHNFDAKVSLLTILQKRKFTEHGAEARHVKRPNLDVQTGTSHEVREAVFVPGLTDQPCQDK